MQAIPGRKLLHLLEADQPLPVRCAAAVVLGEVGARDAELAQALCATLEDGEGALRLEVIKAVGKLRVEKALPQLLEHIKEGGEEAEQAAQAAARMGAKGAKALRALMPRVAPGLRRYIAAALASGTGAEGVEVLLDHDPGVVEVAARSLAAQVPTLSASQRRALADHLLGLLEDPPAELPPASETAVVRLLAALDDPRVGAVLWDRILPSHPLPMRVAALQALGRWVNSPGKDQLRRLFTCAADPDFRVAAPALVLLKDLPVTDRNLPEWLSLLQAPDVAVRHAALGKLGERDSAAVADALLAQADHPDRALREAALARLTRLQHGRAALTRALLEAETPDRAWNLARVQAPSAKANPLDWRDEVFTRACRYLEGSDRRADALLFLLREASPADLRDRLEARALVLRKKKDYAKALIHLHVLARDPACGFATRLELAACSLKVSHHELTPDARAADPALHQLAHLLRDHEPELFAELEKFKWLEPEDLYYAGFHFVEQEGRQKQFGGQVLHLFLKRSPRSKLAQAARSKLRNAGLD
jgi:hypothetical protein